MVSNQKKILIIISFLLLININSYALNLRDFPSWTIETPSMRLCTNDSQCWRNSAQPDDNYCFNRYCRNPFLSRSVGAACRIDNQCSSNLCLINIFGGQCIQNSVPINQQCRRHDQCSSGFCNGNTRTCYPNPNLAVGDFCTYDIECSSRICTYNNQRTWSECSFAYNRIEGKQCWDNRQCISGFCAIVNGYGTCTKKYFRAISEQCNYNEECKSQVCISNICMLNNNLDIGQTCNQDNQCISHICVFDPGTSRKICEKKGYGPRHQCFEDRQCLSNYCVKITSMDGRCQ